MVKKWNFYKHISPYPLLSILNNVINVFFCDFAVFGGKHMTGTVSDHAQHFVFTKLVCIWIYQSAYGEKITETIETQSKITCDFPTLQTLSVAIKQLSVLFFLEVLLVYIKDFYTDIILPC